MNKKSSPSPMTITRGEISNSEILYNRDVEYRKVNKNHPLNPVQNSSYYFNYDHIKFLLEARIAGKSATASNKELREEYNLTQDFVTTASKRGSKQFKQAIEKLITLPLMKRLKQEGLLTPLYMNFYCTGGVSTRINKLLKMIDLINKLDVATKKIYLLEGESKELLIKANYLKSQYLDEGVTIDEKIIKLHKEGMRRKEIAIECGVKYEKVKKQIQRYERRLI